MNKTDKIMYLNAARSAVVFYPADRSVTDIYFAGSPIYEEAVAGAYGAIAEYNPDDNFFEPDEPDVSPRPDELKAFLASIRFDAETGGLALDAMEIATDRDSQGKILAARVKAAADPDFSTTWKALNGWFLLDAPMIVALSDAVLAHVAACFQAEETVAAAIEAGEVTTRAGVDAAFVAARGA